MYRVVGIINDHHIVQTPKGLKKVKAVDTDKKNIRDKIKIEIYSFMASFTISQLNRYGVPRLCILNK